MRARDRKAYTEAWNRHIMQLRTLVREAGDIAVQEWADIEPRLRDYVTMAGANAFPEPSANGDLPNGGES
jgi:hypothetical protein